jgi:hypothetical protein
MAETISMCPGTGAYLSRTRVEVVLVPRPVSVISHAGAVPRMSVCVVRATARSSMMSKSV